MKTKHAIFVLIVIATVIMTLTLTSAITAKIGNARMVLRDIPVDQYEERSILVINDNEDPVTINLIAGGDLKDFIELEEESFSLQPGEEKRAYFLIHAEEEGTFTSKINVQFVPEEGNSAGLSSTIILITENSKGPVDPLDPIDPESLPEEEEDSEEDEEESEGFSLNPSAKKSIEKEEQDEENKKKLLINLAIGSTIILVLVLLGLFLYSTKKTGSKNKHGKRSDNKREKKNK